MATRCPHCGYANPEDLPFCNSCGEPIDPELQMVIGVKNHQPASKEQPKRRYDDEEYVPRAYDDDDEDEGSKSRKGLLVFAAAVVIAVILWALLK